MRISAVALVSLVLSSSCGSPFGPAGTQRLSLALPEAPPSWAALPGLAFELEWIGARGRLERASAAPGSRVAVVVPRGRAQVLVARPSSLGLPFSPAGALYPADLAGRGDPYALVGGGTEELSLDWVGGYVAEVASALEARGLDPWRFDLARLRAEALARVADPWAALAPSEAARRLAAGSFRSDALRARKAFPAILPGPGPWAPESSLAAAPLPSGSGFAVELPEGTHRFVGAEADLFVAVDAEGSAIAVRVPRPPSARRPRLAGTRS